MERRRPGHAQAHAVGAIRFYQLGRIKPYVGALYRRTYIDGLPDIDSAGVVYESYVDCTERVYHSCSSTYPEVSFTIAF